MKWSGGEEEQHHCVQYNNKKKKSLGENKSLEYRACKKRVNKTKWKPIHIFKRIKETSKNSKEKQSNRCLPQKKPNRKAAKRRDKKTATLQ